MSEFRKVLSVAMILSFAVPVLNVVPVQAKMTPDEIKHRKESIHEALLDIYLHQNKKPEIISEFKTLLALRPSDAKLNYKYGHYLTVSNSEAAAIPYLQKAVANDPTNALYAGTLGSAYLRMKNFPKAVEYLRTAVQNPGGDKYKKMYQDSVKYIQYQKQRDELKRRQEEYKKRQEEARKKQEQRAEDDW